MDYDDSKREQKKPRKYITMISVTHNYTGDESGLWDVTALGPSSDQNQCRKDEWTLKIQFTKGVNYLAVEE